MGWKYCRKPNNSAGRVETTPILHRVGDQQNITMHCKLYKADI